MAANVLRIPRHIAIIPDGNRRWAVQHGYEKQDGYEFGLAPGVQALRLAKKYGVEEITFYGYTTDNTKRNTKQVSAFIHACLKAFEQIKKDGCRLLVLGNTSSPRFPAEFLPYTKERITTGQNPIKVNFLVNYGWEWDMSRMHTNGCNRHSILSNLHSRDVSYIDLVIRWGGHTRLSGLLPVQSVYADFFSLEALWPDFSESDFEQALAWYQNLDITRGG